jgi:hypothetical protein
MQYLNATFIIITFTFSVALVFTTDIFGRIP